MNDKQMIEKIRTTFVGEDHIDLAIQHYHNCRKTMSTDNAYQNVLDFINNNFEYFRQFIRDDIIKITTKSPLLRPEVVYGLENKWSMKITRWPDGYSVFILKPSGKISDSKCEMSFGKAREMVEGWKYETATT